MPAWSADGKVLAFVRRDTNGQRRLLLYSLELGIQDFLNPAVTISATPSNASAAAFQVDYGNLSIAPDIRPQTSGITPVTCSASCLSAIASGVLRPTLRTSATIGIIVKRIVGGNRRVLGVSLPRVKAVGRVPLGRRAKGTRTIRWDRRVAGRQLARGRYLVTFRALDARGNIVGVAALDGCGWGSRSRP